MGKRWLGYQDGGNGRWVRHHTGTRWFYIESVDMDDACGRDNEGRDPYVVELSEVDISDEEQMMRAVRSCGGVTEINDETGEVEHFDHDGCLYPDAALAEMMASYGARSPLWDTSGKGVGRMIRAAKSEAMRLERDESAYEARMNRPVNGIGQTAREYAQGMKAMAAAIQRGIDAGDPKATLIGKMYNNCGGNTLGGDVVPPFTLPPDKGVS